MARREVIRDAFSKLIVLLEPQIINPWRACTVRVTVVGSVRL